MKNLNELKVSELSFEETTQIEGGNLIDDIVDAVETAIEVIKNLKKFTPTL